MKIFAPEYPNDRAAVYGISADGNARARAGKDKLVGFVLGRRFLKGSMRACEKRSDSFGQRSCVILRENRPGTPQSLHSVCGQERHTMSGPTVSGPTALASSLSSSYHTLTSPPTHSRLNPRSAI